MSALVLDAGALVAVDRNDRGMAARLRVALDAGMELRTTGIVVAQVWRDASGRQANLARLLRAVDVRAVDLELGRRAGLLLARSSMADAVDATVVDVAATGDYIVTSDPDDIGALTLASGRAIHVISC